LRPTIIPDTEAFAATVRAAPPAAAGSIVIFAVSRPIRSNASA
jgi:hypothetical protein